MARAVIITSALSISLSLSLSLQGQTSHASGFA